MPFPLPPFLVEAHGPLPTMSSCGTCDGSPRRPKAGKILALLILAGGAVGCGADRPAPSLDPGIAGELTLRPGARPADGLLQNERLLAVEAARHPLDLPALLTFLEDPDPLVRGRAAFAMASVAGSGEGFRQGLLARLGDPEPGVRRDAAFALGRQGGRPPGEDAELEAALLTLRTDPDPSVRRAAVEALGFRGGRKASEVLLADAGGARGASGVPSGGDLTQGDAEAVARTQALARLALRRVRDAGDDLVRFLGQSLASGDPDMVGAAALFFAEASDPRLWVGEVEAVVKVLDREEAGDGALNLLAQALANQRNPAVRDRLVRYLSDARSIGLRVGAARGLNSVAYIETPGVREALLHALKNDPSDAVALAAASGLYRGLRIPAWLQDESLVLLAGEDVPPRRQAALLGLVAARFTHEPIVAWVRTRLADDPVAAAEGIGVLGTLPDPPVTLFLFEFADHPDPWVQEAAARALAGRWERILGPDDEILRYRDLFRRLAREGNAGAATAAIRSLTHPVFAPHDPLSILEEAIDARRGTPAGSVLATEFSLALREIGERAAAILSGALPPTHTLADAGGEGGGVTSTDLDVAFLRSLGPQPLFLLESSEVRLAFVLHMEEAPRAVGLLATKANAGVFDGVPFHRVIPGLLAQGGDVVAHDGTGRDGTRLSGELTLTAFGPGSLGAAGGREGEDGFQFFLSAAGTSSLDLEHAVMGSLAAGGDLYLHLVEGARIRRACVIPYPADGSALPTCEQRREQAAG